MAKYDDLAEATGDTRPVAGGGGSMAGGGRSARVGRRRQRGEARALSRERIVEVALSVVDQHGLAALTFRRMGAALDCEAMSIYHNFPSKRHLLDALVEKTLEGIGDPPAELDPIERLRFLGFEYRAMAHRYPKFFPHAALHRLNTPAGVAFIERMVGHFRVALPDERLAAQVFRIFGYYVVGAALDETSGYAAGPSAAEPISDEYISRECPQLAASAPYFKATWFDSTFELGFDMLLKGIGEARATLLSNTRSPKPVVRPKAGADQ
jgi:AcrR family transcriptional regulator